MEQTVVVIFLLFFAVLAFGWFYLQRAKARDAAAPPAETESEPVTGAADAPTDRAD